MIDIEKEELFLFSKPAAYWPTSDRPSLSALHRWRMTGIKANGRVVKLESVKIAGKRYTSKEAVARFVEAQNEPAVPKAPAVRKGPTGCDKLRAIGILD